MCENDFNSEKGLKTHMIFKHTNSTLNCVQPVFIIKFYIATNTVYLITSIFSDPANSVLVAEISGAEPILSEKTINYYYYYYRPSIDQLHQFVKKKKKKSDM